MYLVLDNHDSFVHNLARYLRRLKRQTTIIRSDRIDADACAAMRPEGIVISPGPHRPEQAGCSVEVVRRLGHDVPILGICLGHQAIGAAYGGRIVRCGAVHGIAGSIDDDGDAMFDQCDRPLVVGRYHSLAIDPAAVPDELRVTAKTADGVIMAVRHRSDPVWGWQFHPESVLTPQGDRMLKNFVDFVDGRNELRPPVRPAASDNSPGDVACQRIAS